MKGRGNLTEKKKSMNVLIFSVQREEEEKKINKKRLRNKDSLEAENTLNS